MELGQAALREARRKGLKIHYVGKRGFYLGSDLIDFIRNETLQQINEKTGKNQVALWGR